MLRLYRKSQEEPLSSAELLKVEEMRKQYPWFSLPWFMLAKNRLSSNVKGELVLAASAYAPNRVLLHQYLTGAEEYPSWDESMMEIELNQIITPTDLTHSSPIVSTSEVEAIIHPDQSVETFEEKAPEFLPKEEEEDLTPVHGEVNPLPDLVTTPQEILTQPVAESTPEIPVVPVVPAVEPVISKQPVTVPQPGINWGLNTRISIRTSQYLRQAERIRKEIAAFKSSFLEPAPETETAPAPEIQTVSEVSEDNKYHTNYIPETIYPVGLDEPVNILEKPIELPTYQDFPKFSPAKVHAPESNSEPSDHLIKAEPEPLKTIQEIPELKEVQPDIQVPEPEPQVETRPEVTPIGVVEVPKVQTPLEKTMSLIEGLEKADKEKSAPADSPSVFEAEYKIGSFSGFAFLGGPEEEEFEQGQERGQGQEFGHEPEVIKALNTGKEIILNEEHEGRSIEISVTEEQLQKYFKGKLPAALSKPQKQAEKPATPEKKTTESKDFKVRPVAQEAVLERRKYVTEMIEKFIENEPGLDSIRNHKVTSENLAKSSLEENDNMVTETLAKIHVKQGNVAKAIKIYQKLALQFPEKKDYFASLIVKLK